MPKKALNAKVMENLKAPETGRLELWDAKLPGFGLRVTSNDRRTWFVMYRIGARDDRRQRRMTIGDAKVMSLGKARELAEKALRKVDRGKDPAIKDDDEPDDTIGTVREIVYGRNGEVDEPKPGSYLAHVKKNTRPGTYKEMKRIFDVDVLTAWGDRPIAAITRPDVRKLADKIAARGAEIMANRTIAHLKTFFAWAADADQGYITTSPIDGMKPVAKESDRDRYLNDVEIGLFWEATGTLGWPFGHLFRLQLATAQRRDEVGTIELAEIDIHKRLWIIPRRKAKNDKEHHVHLSELAVEIIEDALATRDRIAELKPCRYLFTTTGKAPVSGYSRAKERLDKEMERLARKARGLPENDAELRAALKLKDVDELPRYVPDWILHDLRRTATTGMARLGVAPHIADKILNHVSGTIRGVAAVYNRHAYLEERRDALEQWARYIKNPGNSNVIPFAARG